MSTQAGELVVRIVGDGTNLARDVESKVNGAAQGAIKGANRGLSSIGSRARDMGTKMSLAATLPLLALGKSAVDAASATVEAVNKTNVVFGDAADQVLAFSDTSAKAFGISKREALGAAGTFGNLFRAMGVGEKQAATTSVAMTSLAGDLASFNDADPSEVLDALQSGLLGEAEPMRKFGVQLSEARVQAEALATGLVKPVKSATEVTAANLKVEASIKALATAEKEHGKNSLEARKAQNDLTIANDALAKATKGVVPPLTDAQKLQARQSIIMKDTALAQGDFQRSLSTSAANQQRVSKALADDAQAAIGGQILPLYQKAIVKVGQLAEWFGKLSPEAKRNVAIFGGIAVAAGPVLTIFGNLIKLGGGVAKGISAGAKGISATVDAAKRLGQGYKDAQAAESAFSGKAGTIGGKLSSASTAMVDGGKKAAAWAATTAKSAASAAASMARAAAAQIASLVKTAAAYVAQGARMAATMAATAARTVAAWLLMAAQSLAAAARMALSWIIAMGPIGLIIAAVVALAILIVKNWDKIKAATMAVFGAIGAFIGKAWNKIKAMVSGAVGFVVNFVKSHWRLLIAIMLGPLGIIIGLVTKNWDKIKAVFAAALGIVKKVVSVAIAAVVAYFTHGVQVWVSIFTHAKDFLVKIAGAIKDGVVNAFNALVGAVSSAIGRVLGVAQTIKDKVVSAVSGAASWLLSAGHDVVQGLINGIVGMGGALWSAITNFIDEHVPGAVKKLLGIASPSKVFRRLGQWVVKGLILGLTDDPAAVKAASEKLANLVSDAYEARAKANQGKLSAADKHRRDALLRLIEEERTDQVKLAKAHAKLLGELTKARDNLKALQGQARDYARDVAKALVDSANITAAMPEGVAITAESLTERLTKQLEDAKAFAANIAKLTANGLNATSIQQIVDAGVAGGSAAAEALANATPEQIAQINALQQQLAKQGKELGQTASDELYGAGIKAAEGLVRGLEQREHRMAKVMERQAQVFANAVRRGLGMALHDFNGKKPGRYTNVPDRKHPTQQHRGERVTVDAAARSSVRDIITHVHNPVPEKASETVPKRLRRLQQTGVLK